MATTGSVSNNVASDFILEKQTRKPTNDMGRDQFLTVLLAQLKNQDPTSPMENTDMMAQMAQFSALEATQSMATVTSASQAYGMIGKGIVGVIRDNTTGAVRDVVGTVDSAGVENGKPYIKVGNAQVWISDVSQVFDSNIITGNSTQMLAGTSMVGKYVRAEFPADDNGSPIFIEGQVERVSVRDNKLYVTVDGVEVGLYQIINVAETYSQLGDAPTTSTYTEEEN